MRRLIDLDKALAKAEDECRMSDDWKVAHEMMNVFKYQPTVKAIPIEWIVKFRNQFDEADDFYDLLDTMLSIWEKEHEAD